MENQENKNIILSPIDPLGVRLFINEHDDEIQSFNIACSFCAQHGYSGWRENTHGLYLLRGKSRKDVCLMMALLEVPEFPKELGKILERIQYYNEHGEQLFSAEKARGELYPDFMLRNVAADCGQICDTADGWFISGRGQSHVWVSDQGGKRVLIVHF